MSWETTRVVGNKTTPTMDPEKLPDNVFSQFHWTRGQFQSGSSSSDREGGEEAESPAGHTGAATDAASAGEGSSPPAP